MSKILETETEFNDINVLRMAMEQQGFQPVYEEGYPSIALAGYEGPFQANLGIRRANFEEVTGAFTYGDVGFQVKAGGALGLIGDDILLKSNKWTDVLDGLKSAYAEQWHNQTMYSNGYTVTSRTLDAEGNVQIEYAPLSI